VPICPRCIDMPEDEAALMKDAKIVIKEADKPKHKGHPMAPIDDYVEYLKR
jgi:hypothetical protein